MALGRSIYHDFPTYPFRAPPELAGAAPRHPVVIVGAGPVGLTLAIGLARYGVKAVVIDPRDAVSFGSRATCISRRSIEILERFGAADGILGKGLGWTSGRSFWREHRLVLQFEMAHDSDQKHLPMVNLQQCYAEQFLVDVALGLPEIDLRWRSRLVAIEDGADAVRLRVATPEGEYEAIAEHVVACDGARSFVRSALGLRLEGTSYEGRYLIADIRLESGHPTERRAWFDPPSNPRSTVLMHKQPDDIWRVDYQLRDEEDAELEQREERVRARIDAHLAMVGERPDYELVWISLYKAHCRTLKSYRHGRILFAGDAAHLVPIFGVRGLNSGFEDAGNLAWKLAAVVQRRGGDALLDSYSRERVLAAAENIRQARKSTLFMTPPDDGHQLMREAALSLAVSQPFARALVNPRQTTALAFPDSPLSTADGEPWAGAAAVGATLPNCPVRLHRGGRRRAAWLLDAAGTAPAIYIFMPAAVPALAGLQADVILVTGTPVTHPCFTVAEDVNGRAAALLDGAPGATYLVRPDAHVAARWKTASRGKVEAGMARLLARTP